MNDRGGITVQWLGDIALTGQFVEPANHELLRSNVAYLARELHPCDLRIANWEAPIVGAEGVSPHKKVAVFTDEDTARQVRGIRLDAALIANNHIFDCLGSGFERTTAFLEGNGTSRVGAGIAADEAAQPLLMERNGYEVVLLAYVDEDTHPQVPENQSLHLNILEPERVLDEVRHWARANRTVLVHFHCGMDFLPVPTPRHRELAREAIKAGAAVVVCYHPHRLQGYERFGDGLILYGLGNLIAGSIYPWPEFTEPTAVVTCRVEGLRVVDLQLQYFIFRDGVLGPDRTGRGAKIHRRNNRRIALDEKRYVGDWSRSVAYDLFVTRPIHFIRRHKSPRKMLAALEMRQAAEYWGLFRKMWNRSRR